MHEKCHIYILYLWDLQNRIKLFGIIDFGQLWYEPIALFTPQTGMLGGNNFHPASSHHSTHCWNFTVTQHHCLRAGVTPFNWRAVYAFGCSFHYNDVIMGAIASQITSLTIVYSIVYSDADQRKHQSSASLAFVLWIHRGPVNSPHKWPVTRKIFPFDDVIIHCKMRSLVVA